MLLVAVFATFLIGSATGAQAPAALSVRPDGAELVYIPEEPASAQNPLYGPNSTRLAFTLFHEGYNDGPAGIFLLTPESPPSPLIDEPGQDCVNLPGSAWNAPTDRIAFSSDRAGREEIWTIRPDGTDLTRVTEHSEDLYFIEPSFSPDGEWIVFEADQGVPDDRQQGSIWKVRSDGSDLTVLTDGPAGGTDDRQPNWSPFGDRILFQRRTPGSEDWNLFTMAAGGSDIRQVTTWAGSDTDASWSYDGAWIVYSSDHGGLERPSVFVIQADGGEPLRVTSDPSAADGAPCWSPDGNWIAFESHEDDAHPASLWRIAAPFFPGSCALLCTATVPATAAVDVPVLFAATATPFGTCTGTITYGWDFGDGSARSTEPNPSHAYAAAGTYTWQFGASVDLATCTEPGAIVIRPAVTPPSIAGIAKAGSPFRLVVLGSNFHPGCAVRVEGSPVPSTTYKDSGRIVAKRGRALKAMVPAGVPVRITVLNTDDGGVSAPFIYTR